MKKLVTNYTFAPGAAGVGTITFLDYTAINKSGLLLVTNSTNGVTLYNFADSTLLGTVATNVLTLATATTGQNAADKLVIYYDDAAVALPDLIITGATAQTVTGNNALLSSTGTAAIDVSGFHTATVQIVSTGTAGTYTFEGSNDNVNFQTIPVWNQNVTTGAVITAAITASASQLIYTFPVTTRYVRLRVGTTITGGSIQAFSKFAPESHFNPVTQIAQNTAGSLQVTADTELPAAAASADALGNPTTPQVGADQLQFNGATWDRVRNNSNTTTGDTGAKTATFNGATQVNFNGRGAMITCLIGAVTGTSPTLALQLQWSPDGGTTWLNYGPAHAAFTPVAAQTYVFEVYPTVWADNSTFATPAALSVGATAAKVINAPLPRTWRIAYTIGGTTPSITLTGVYVNYLS